MATGPEISVVMSVYNGAETLRETIESILSQQGVSLEFIIVNDGSTDGTGEILNACAERDSRVRCIHQQNTGLTRALIRGCQEAKASYIARQDAGDRSLPGRLKSELELVRADPSIVLVSCGTRFVLPDGEPLYDSTPSSDEIVAGLNASTLSDLRGPSSHPATIFRTDAYHRVGGYRGEFHIGQDLDLWVRLAEIGNVGSTQKVLYEATYSFGGISAGKAKYQQEINKTILICAMRRRSGHSDSDILTDAEAVTRRAKQAKRDMSEALYFVGAVLLKRSPEKARHYFRRALQENPGHLKAWIRMVSSYLPRPI